MIRLTQCGLRIFCPVYRSTNRLSLFYHNLSSFSHIPSPQYSTSSDNSTEEFPVPQLVVLTGCTGVGKTSVLQALVSRHPHKFGFSISHTTRAPRSSEIQGKHYHFVSRADFMRLKTLRTKDGECFFLETTEFAGHMYGTSWKSVRQVIDSGRSCFLDLDVNGLSNLQSLGETGLLLSALNLLDSLQPFCFVAVIPPSEAALMERLNARHGLDQEQLEARVERAKLDLLWFQEQDNLNRFHYVLVNDTLERIVHKMENILLNAAKAEDLLT